MGPKSASTTSPRRRGRPTSKETTTTSTKTVAVPKSKDIAVAETSCFDSALKFTLLTASSLLLSSALFSLSIPITKGDLAWTSKRLDTWKDVVALLSWRVLELGIPWFSGYDAWDVSCFIGLIHLPTYSLLLNFYNIRPTTILTVAAITTLSCTIPFSYFRPLSAAHSGGVTTANRAILSDRLTTIYTTVASTLVYTLVLYLSFATWLPVHLVTYFTGLPDISAAHAGAKGFLSLFLSLLPAGYGTRDLLFVTSASQPQEKKIEKKTTRRRLRSADSQVEEDLQEDSCIASLYKKAWLGLSPNLRVLISRSAVLALMTLANTFVQLGGTINGVEPKGALGWGATWSLATLINAALYGWIQEANGR
ncbi:uncharacterized protein GIQ15_01105 [Arthroderma uncinatum]|uniref:uncharacterized protein n=1 Tax=Arthroderma uncinatum TaxID=74035 RepID=UPI00144AB0E4|nr:uncharacterized protein GIQ15_01105 [Arthroderma uncinatum]KAF3491588.1 hypothetical protein GIQ15_01105 [Arthroderma uncinatum]